MESLPLKELDFGLQNSTGPSSGVVASIVLIIIALSSVSFLFFLHNSHTFQIVLEDTCTSNHFSGTFKISDCCCFQNHKKSKLCHTVIFHIIGKLLCYSTKRTQNFSFSHFIIELFGFLWKSV